MGYTVDFADMALVRSGYSCEACGRNWNDFEVIPGDAPIDVHSANSLHTIRDKSGLFRVTSTPEGFSRLIGRLIRPEPFLVHHYGLDDDAFCLCRECHVKVHSIALTITKSYLVDHKGRNSTPFILEQVTIIFIENGGAWTY